MADGVARSWPFPLILTTTTADAMGLYFEEFEVGRTYVTGTRTLTEEDIDAFAMLSGDQNRLHTDDVFARTMGFAGRIAHGLLGAAILTGLSYRTGLFDGTTLAFLSINWQFRAPVFAGDTLYAEMLVESKRETSNPDRGIVVRHVRLLNQSGTVTQEGTISVMVKRRPA
ncbi:MAG: MaoC/PaaZ C-terminal domain-containing protein [Steroidobacteraceae bacterium]